MATIRVVARKNKAKKGGDDLASGRKSTTWPIYLRLVHKGRMLRLSLGLRVRAANWNDAAQGGHWVRKTHPEQAWLNRFLSERLAIAQREAAKLELASGLFSVEELRDHVQAALDGDPGSDSEAAIPYFWQLADGYKREGKFASAERYRQMIRKLEAFQKERGQPKERLTFSTITPAYLRQLREYLSDTDGLAHNTVAKHLRGLRTLYYAARREGMASGANSFEQITITEKRPAKTSLSRSELERLAECEVPEEPQEADIAPAVARDMFLLSAYAQGIRRSDCLLLEWDGIERGQNGQMKRLRYTMRKNDKPRSVKLVRPAQEVLERYADRAGDYTYIFSPMDGWTLKDPEAEFKALNKMGDAVNAALREAAEEAKIKKHLTFHVARHTFARLADEAGWPLRKIQGALGHATSRTTERYLRQVRGADLDDDMEKLFGR